MKIFTPDKKLNVLITLTMIAVGVTLLSTFGIPPLFFKGKNEFFGDYGSFLSGVIGSVTSLVTVILVYLTYILQQKLLESQKEELTETRNQLKRQQFENIYFKMLDVIREIGKEIQNSIPEDYFKVFIDNLSNDFVNIIGEKNTLNRHEIRIIEFLIKYETDIYDKSDITSLLFRLQQGSIEKSRVSGWYKQSKIIRAQTIIGAIYEKRFIDSNLPFANYFRYIINAIDYVEQEITEVEYGVKLKDERKKYIKLLSALLTNNQLVVLFYSCLSRISYDTNGQPKAKEMMEEYEFFKNLLPENLIRPWHQEFYKIPYKFPYDKEKDGVDK